MKVRCFIPDCSFVNQEVQIRDKARYCGFCGTPYLELELERAKKEEIEHQQLTEYNFGQDTKVLNYLTKTELPFWLLCIIVLTVVPGELRHNPTNFECLIFGMFVLVISLLFWRCAVKKFPKAIRTKEEE